MKFFVVEIEVLGDWLAAVAVTGDARGEGVGQTGQPAHRALLPRLDRVSAARLAGAPGRPVAPPAGAFTTDDYAYGHAPLIVDTEGEQQTVSTSPWRSQGPFKGSS